MHSFMYYYKEQIARWTKATKNWEWNSGVYIFIVIFHSSFPFFKIMQSKNQSRDNLKLLPFIFRGPKTKLFFLARLARDRQRRYSSSLVNLGDQVERWRKLCTRLDVCDRKLAKLLLDKQKKRFLILLFFLFFFFFWLIGVVYRNHTFKYSTSKCVFA